MVDSVPEYYKINKVFPQNEIILSYFFFKFVQKIEKIGYFFM